MVVGGGDRGGEEEEEEEEEDRFEPRIPIAPIRLLYFASYIFLALTIEFNPLPILSAEFMAA